MRGLRDGRRLALGAILVAAATATPPALADPLPPAAPIPAPASATPSPTPVDAATPAPTAIEAATPSPTAIASPAEAAPTPTAPPPAAAATPAPVTSADPPAEVGAATEAFVAATPAPRATPAHVAPPRRVRTDLAAASIGRRGVRALMTCVFPDSGPCQLDSSECSQLGTPGDDVLTGSAASDLLCGLGGNDILRGEGGDDTLVGGEGDDTLDGGPGADCLIGGRGRNRFPGLDDGDIAVDGPVPPPHGGGAQVPVVASDGSCTLPGSGGGGEGGGGGPQEAGGGAVAPTPTPPAPDVPQGGAESGQQTSSTGVAQAPVQAGSLLVAIALLAQRDTRAAGQASAFGVASSARAWDGAARLLLHCPDTPAAGTVSLTAKLHGHERRIGRARFACSPPSQVAVVRLERAALDRLTHAGVLHARATVTLDGGAAPLHASVELHPLGG